MDVGNATGKLYVRKTGTVFKGRISNVVDSIRNTHVGKAAAIQKSPRRNLDNAVCHCHSGKFITARESVASNTGNPVLNGCRQNMLTIFIPRGIGAVKVFSITRAGDSQYTIFGQHPSEILTAGAVGNTRKLRQCLCFYRGFLVAIGILVNLAAGGANPIGVVAVFVIGRRPGGNFCQGADMGSVIVDGSFYEIVCSTILN